jgi:glycosyltransferase involved in cell wall biosynthesis
VVHSHVHHFSGLVLAVARHAGVPGRIAHSHLDTSREDERAGRVRRLYLASMKAAIHRYATNGLAVSEVAAVALFGARWRDDPRWGVMYCALDFSAYRSRIDRAALRGALGLPPGALGVVHVGRFDHQKNHPLLVKIAAEVLRREPRAYFVLVGDGPQRPAVEAEVARLRIGNRVLFAGVRSDVPQILRACDLFLLPSLFEGLPLAGLEAQAAGLPVVLTDTITRELAVIPELLVWRSLSDPPDVWADTVVAKLRGPRPEPHEALSAMERSQFNLAQSMDILEDIYGASSGARGARRHDRAG